MFPIRRFSGFIPRLFLAILLFSTFFTIIFTLVKYFTQNDNLPVRNNLHKYHYHKHDKHIINTNNDIIERISTFEKSRSAPQSSSIKIGGRSVELYVHFDLKGAAPKISYFEKLFPLLHKWGATGVCMEYEDMFPFDGIVSSIKHKQAYSKDDIEQINQLAEDNHLDVMPLLQTYDQVSWINQLNSYIPTKWQNFDGIILTGWSRYDHFLSLCELLPYSIPSMAFSLAAWQEPFKSLPRTDIFLNQQLQQYVQKQLQCSSPLHLNIQDHANKPTPKCKFPGAGVYESIISLSRIWSQVHEAESFVNKYVTDLHVRYNYIHTKRGEECLEKLTPAIESLKNFITTFTQSMDEIFPAQVAIEWLETYFMKRYRSVNERYEFIQRAIKGTKILVT